MFAGIYLHVLGGDDCGIDRLYPSGITADTEYSSSYPVENLIDGNRESYWFSGNGDTSDNVYLEFSHNVDIKHITVYEGTLYVSHIYIYDGNTGATKAFSSSADAEDYKV